MFPFIKNRLLIEITPALLSLLTYSLSVYASYVSLTESEFVPPLPLSLMSGEPAAVGIAGKQSSLLGQSKIFSASQVFRPRPISRLGMVLFVIFNFSLCFFLFTCKIAGMVHKMNKQCEQKSNAELLEEVVPGAPEGRKSLLLPYHTLFTGHGKLSVY